MHTVELSEADKQQVYAILMTHSEMQDARINDTMQVRSRLAIDHDGDEDTQDMIDNLDEQTKTFEDDSDNLRRIAGLFE